MNEKARKLRVVVVFVELCGSLRIPQLQIYIQEGAKALTSKGFPAWQKKLIDS
jgi:hypothetical protein